MVKRIIITALALAALGLVFWVLERRWRARPVKSGADLRTDLFYWFLTPLVSRPLARLGSLLVVVPLLWLAGRDISRQALIAGHGPAAQWPHWLQAVSVIVMGDFIGYWMHRGFHRGRLWRIHAVHHSSVTLDWLSSVRVHPLNDLITRMVQAVPFVACGFSPMVVATFMPFLGFYAIFIHADLDWDFGRLRYILATPAFHRWHHTSEEQGINRNFAGLLPLWDLLFGTFYMPEGQKAQRFGVSEMAIPSSLPGQLAWPFRG